MQIKSWNIIYAIVLAVDIGMVLADFQAARYITKPLLMATLGVYALVSAASLQQPSRNLVFLALLFSWWGDVFLIFDTFFVLGLASFLMAHVMYAWFFLRIRPVERFNWAAIAVITVYAVFLLCLLWPHLGLLRPAVLLYTIVISVMWFSTVRAFGLRPVPAITGATLFVISDSVLALHRFLSPFAGGEVVIMLTYGIAQWFLVKGCLEYLTLNRR